MLITANTVSPPNKLTDWKNEPKLSDLQWDFTQTKTSHSSHTADVKTWLDNLYVQGTAKIKNTKGSSIVPKLIRKNAEWRYPALSEPFLSTTELFQVSPVSWADTKAAEQNALVLNNQFQTKINRVAFIDEMVRTCVDEGSVIIRTGWEFKEGTVKEMQPIYQYHVAPQAMQQIQQWVQGYQQDPVLFKQLNSPDAYESAKASLQYQQPVLATKVGEQEVEVTKTLVNKPTLEICDINNVYIDPTCNGDMDKAQFIIHSFETTYAELKRDQRYKNIDSIQIQNTTVQSDPDHTYQKDTTTMQFADKARQKLTVYEYWGYWDTDDNGTVRPIVAAWVGDTLIRLEDNPFADQKLPFVIIQYLPKRKSVYGVPDGELLEDNQKIIGAVTRGMIDILGKSANAQTGIKKGMLDATNRIRFERGDDYEFNPNVDPRQGVYMHTFTEIPQSAQFMVQMMTAEAESLTGIKSFSGSQGISGAALGDTNLGIRSAMDAASKREMSILRRISEGVVKIGRKIIAMNSQFLEEEEVVRITDETFVAVKRDDLAGNFDLKLTISTAEGDEAQAQQIAFMMQTIGNNMDPMMRNKMLAKIFRLRKMYDFAHEIENFQPQPDPFQQQMQQLELQKAQAEIALLQAQAQEAATKGSLNSSKVPVEQARASSLQGDADKKSLDFVQQQQGIPHEQNMQMQQAKNQAALDSQAMKQEHDVNMAVANHSADVIKQHAQMNHAHNSALLQAHATSQLQNSQNLNPANSIT